MSQPELKLPENTGDRKASKAAEIRPTPAHFGDVVSHLELIPDAPFNE